MNALSLDSASSPRKGEPQETTSLRWAREALAGLDLASMGTTQAHDAVQSSLADLGWEVGREFTIASRGTPDGYRGRLDLLARDGDTLLAVEVDNRSVRAKSRYKVAFAGRRWGAWGAVVLRQPGAGSPLALWVAPP